MSKRLSDLGPKSPLYTMLTSLNRLKLEVEDLHSQAKSQECVIEYLRIEIKALEALNKTKDKNIAFLTEEVKSFNLQYGATLNNMRKPA